MSVTKTVLTAAVIALLSTFFLFNSCSGLRDHGQGGGTAPAGSSGTVSTFVTGDASQLVRMITTIQKIEIVSTETGSACEVLSVPTKVNFAGLAGVMQIVNSTDCPAGHYDTIRLELDKSALLATALTGTNSGSDALCPLTAAAGEAGGTTGLACNGPLCSLDTVGSVDVVVGRDNTLALDFRDFTVLNPVDPSACGVTMSVSQLPADTAGFPDAITGLVADLSIPDHTLNVARGSILLPVDYSGIDPLRQQGLDELLRIAENDDLRIRLMSPSIGLSGTTTTAADIVVKMEGIVSGLDAGSSTCIISRASASTPVDYSAASVHGVFEPGAKVSLRLYGFNGTHYLASRVYVESGVGLPDS